MINYFIYFRPSLRAIPILFGLNGTASAGVFLEINEVRFGAPYNISVMFTLQNDGDQPICIGKNILFQMHFRETGILFGTDSDGNDLLQPSLGLNLNEGAEIVSDLASRFSIIAPHSSVTSVILDDGLWILDKSKDLSAGIKTLQIVFPYLICPEGTVVRLDRGAIPYPMGIPNMDTNWVVLRSNTWSNPYLEN
jgi:hypothetical protein